MVTRTPPRRTGGPVSESRGNGQAAPASAAATQPGFVDGKPTESFYDLGGEDTPAGPSALAQAQFVETVRERSVGFEAGGSADVEIVERMAEEADQDPLSLEAEIERIRQFRKPLGGYTQKLALPKRQGYHRHWFNDVAGRIDEATVSGWAHVLGTDKKPISRCVGTGRDKGAMYAFAMEIPEVFWLEDMQARHADAQAKVDALRAAPFRAQAGTAQASDKGKFYDPSDGEAGPLQVVKGR